MARDYLAIQGSSVPCELAFSSGGLTDTNRRNRLSTETFEGLQLLKSSFKLEREAKKVKLELELKNKRELWRQEEQRVLTGKGKGRG